MNRDRSAPTTFSEPEAQRILARAAEIEGAIGNRFTAEELRQIAATAGIDSRALEHAMNEPVQVPATVPTGAANPMTAKQVAVLAGTGAVLAAMALVADNTVFGRAKDLTVLAPSAIYAIWHALRHPTAGRITGLLRELGLVFGSFTSTIILTQGIQDAGPATTWALVCCGLGSAIVSIRGGSTDLNPASDEAR
jgi:hypothetical protein